MPDPDKYCLRVGVDGDATTQMAFAWQSVDGEGADSYVTYRKAGATTWLTGNGWRVLHAFTTDRYWNHVELSELDPDSLYEFRFTSTGGTTVYTFRTFPTTLAGGRQVKLALGGDARSWDYVSQLLQTYENIRSRDVDAFVFLGDFACSDALESRLGEELLFWEQMSPRLVRPDNRVIPLMPTTGNHEVLGGYSTAVEDRPYYEGAFPSRRDPTDGCWYHVAAGDYLLFLLLDTHAADLNNPPAGQNQVDWVQAQLTASTHTYQFAGSHIGPYPGGRPITNNVQTQVRERIVPILEQHGMQAYFQAHDHFYFRSHIIKDGAVDPTGIKYFGDGNLGVNIREDGNDGEWWVEHIDRHLDRSRHHYVLTLSE